MAEYNETILLEAIKEAKEMPSNAVATTKKFKGMEYQDVPGYPYIFEEGKFSAFGPQQIQKDLVTDVKNNLSSLVNAEDVPEGFTEYLSQLEYDTKMKRNAGLGYSRIKDDAGKLITIDKSKYGPLLQGSISTEQHQQFYPLLASLGLKRKIQLIPEGQDINVENIARAWHSNPDQTINEQYGAAVREKYESIIGADITPATQPTEDYKPIEQDKPETNQTERAFTLDYPGELPDIGDSVDMPDVPDVAPSAEVESMLEQKPKEKNIFERTMDYFFPEEDLEKVQERDSVREDLLDELDKYSTPKMNKGGAVMEKQMEMFEDGGLMDEGGTVDPVSGNDVPPGSTQEEVRDDIPAQLSEGEFVFPADVVRYWGLEKLMEMRQEAKAGLARMEAMGQMGNSDEAVLPDDIPFSLDDLDMEDDEEYNMAVGGFVPNQFGIYQQPSQFATYTQQPYQPPTGPTLPTVPSTQQPIQTGFTPVTTPVTPTAPTFEQLLPTTTGRYDELREYENKETGQKMTIPFVDGKPIYPIPTGFTPVATDVIEPTETPEVTTPSATVVEGDKSQEGMEPDYSTTDPTGIGFDKGKLSTSLNEAVSKYGLGFAGLGEMFGGASIVGAVSSLFGGEEKATPNMFSSATFGGVLDSFRDPTGKVSFSASEATSGIKTGAYDVTTPLHELPTVVQANIAEITTQVVTELEKTFLDEDGKPISKEKAQKNIETIANKLGVDTKIPGTNINKKLTTLYREVGKVRAAQIKAEQEAAEAAKTAAAQASYEKALKEDTSPSYEGASETVGQAAKDRDPTGTAGVSTGAPMGMSDWGDYKGAFVGESYIEKKGLANKKPKPKKMKRGGLASKK